MSSGTRVDPYGAKRVQEEVSQRLNDKVRRLGLSPRQQVLNELWAHYRCMFYDARSVEWDGSKRQVGVERLPLVDSFPRVSTMRGERCCPCAFAGRVRPMLCPR